MAKAGEVRKSNPKSGRKTLRMADFLVENNFKRRELLVVLM
jgi:hypothetical protein